jgi:hypothetical protein
VSTGFKPPGDPRAHVAGQLRAQARSCEQMGSPLYTRILDAAARDVEEAGPAWGLLQEHLLPGRGDALALRLMAAVHRMVLTGAAPGLNAFYPSVGGNEGVEGAWPAFRQVLARERERLHALITLPCQTNEVGRCAALMWGFLEVAAENRLPLRVLEVGASAGLNLRFDRFRYGGGGASWGNPSSRVDLHGFWREASPYVDAALSVAERRGCDPHPLDLRNAEARLALQASLWADQTDRFSRLRGALEEAAELPAEVDEASVDAWLPPLLGEPRPGLATVVYHSVLDEYLGADVRARFHAALHEAGGRATVAAPLAWVRLEPTTGYRALGLTVTTWPGGRERLSAICGAHGTDTARP